MIGLGTTVLVAYEIREVVGHERVREYIQSASQEGGEQYLLAPQVIQEFLHVVTDPRRFERPLEFSDALKRARTFWESSEVVRCHPDDGAFAQFGAWMDEFRLGRKRILDTYLAATYFTHGSDRIATANPADFRIFAGFSFEEWAIIDA